MKRNYIGLASSAHDGALAILDSSGRIAFAEGAERWLQYKRALNIAADVPLLTAAFLQKYCEPDAEIVLAFSWSDGWATQLRSRLQGMAEATEQWREIDAPTAPIPTELQRQAARSRYFTLSQVLAQEASGNTLEYEGRQLRHWNVRKIERRHYDHHLTHATAASLSSPFENAACAVVDGYGEGRATASYVYESGRLREIGTGERRHLVTHRGVSGSLGFFYMNVCEACGFSPVAGEEWKVMGLAPYGKPNARIYGLLREMIRVEGLTLCTAEPDRMQRLRQRLESISRRPGQPALAAADLAYSGQTVFEETVFDLLNNLHATTAVDDLVWTGGCALNSSANGAILRNTPFKRLHVMSAPADDGTSLGAALLAFQDDHPSKSHDGSWQSPYIGSGMDPETIERVRRFAGTLNVETCHGTSERAAELLAQGKLVGWVRGRAEFGPRALGNRSILADPRSAQIKDKINATVKFREEFRPFAPSILHEWGPMYFEDYQESPYMERTLRFREEVRTRVPGVVHVDGTGRLQSVKREWNAPFYDLISAFHKLTGVPLVLNTSFNVMGKPIAHSVEDAIAVFATSGLDALFIEDLLIQK